MPAASATISSAGFGTSKATVLLVGFQAQGTLGRFLDDGAKAVRIQGEEIKVAARIRRIDDYSGHADGPELARWIAARRPIQRGVFLVHGEEPAHRGLARAHRRADRAGGESVSRRFSTISMSSHSGADAARCVPPPEACA